MAEKCTTHKIQIHRLEDEVADPALAALIEKGWSALGTVVLDDGTKPILHIILAPPKNTKKQKALLMLAGVTVFELAILIALKILF